MCPPLPRLNLAGAFESTVEIGVFPVNQDPCAGR
jgi:hypothetical protein